MLDFMGNLSAVLITFVIVAGFIAVGSVLVFEFATMAVFWLKHVYRKSSEDVDPLAYTRPRHLRGQPQT